MTPVDSDELHMCSVIPTAATKIAVVQRDVLKKTADRAK